MEKRVYRASTNWACAKICAEMGLKMENGRTLEKYIRGLTAGMLGGMVVALAVGFFFMEKREFSENENRYLAKLPSFGLEKVQSGEYMKDLETYLADHFPFRDFFMGMKTKAETSVGKKEVNGIYMAEDGYLIEKYEKPENTEKIGRILKDFAGELEGQDVELRLMLVPTAVYVYEDKLPDYAPVRNQMETADRIYKSSGILPIDCSGDLMEHKEEGELYYKTDHHWTTFGAYIGYQAYCREMGLDAVPIEEMDARIVTEDFCGTVYSKAGDYGREGDEITVYTNPADCLTVEYKDTGEITDSLYNLEYVEAKDKYSLFLDNLHPLIEITNETAVSDRELVLVKDSYANSMVPFLVHHYKKIYVFDTRYYKQGVSEFIREHKNVSDVLVLYNMNTLDGDLGIRGVY